MNIYLTGYRGSGKSTVGKMLATVLAREFRDIDEIIVARAGKSIREIFDLQGEQAFRDLESQAIVQSAALDNHVIALGGGALLRPQNQAAIRSGPHRIVYLRCLPAELHRRIQADPQTSRNRPSLTHLGGSLQEIERLLAQREPIYKQAMTDELDVTTLTPDQAIQRLVQMLLTPQAR